MSQPIAEDTLTVDPSTGVPVERVLFAPAIHVKGGALRERQKRLLDREAERGANEHDEKMRAKRAKRV